VYGVEMPCKSEARLLNEHNLQNPGSVILKNGYSGIVDSKSWDKSCVSFLIPGVGYSYNNVLKHGITANFRFLNAVGNCECGAMFGGLCYLIGSSYGLQGGWYPATQSVDISANISFRYLYMFAEINGGYSMSKKFGFPRSFIHVGPSIGFDLGVAKLTLGYSFRTARINSHFGSFVGELTFYPFSFNENERYKTYFR